MSRASSIAGKTKQKLVFLGDQGAGKSSIIQRFSHDRFQDKSNPTIGIDFIAKNFYYDGRSYRLQLWDTAGQQRFKSLIPGYLKDAICAIFVFDMTNEAFLPGVDNWLSLFRENKSPHALSVLCANKIDLIPNQKYTNTSYPVKIQHSCRDRTTVREVAAKFAKQQDLLFFEVSAKTGEGINEMFTATVQAIANLGKRQTKSTVAPAPVQKEKVESQIKNQNIANPIRLVAEPEAVHMNIETQRKKCC